jgi:hypothetical protein
VVSVRHVVAVYGDRHEYNPGDHPIAQPAAAIGPSRGGAKIV